MAHDEIIDASIGSCGYWQCLVFFLVILVSCPLGMQEFSIDLLAPPITSNCSDDKYDKCSSDCPSIVWNKAVFEETITMEWNLICEKEWLAKFSQTIFLAGIFVGSILFGLLSDKYGRRKPMIVAALIEMVMGIPVAFAPNIWLFLLLRFLLAIAAGGTLCIGFVLITECVGRKYRTYFSTFFLVYYFIGQLLLGLIGYFIRKWRYVQIIISIPIFLSIIYYWFLPESPRWLLSVGKYEKAIEVMEKAAQMNKLPVENVKRNVLDRLEHTVPEEETFLNLFRHPVVRLRAICIFLSWIVLGVCIYACAQYKGGMVENIFGNMSLDVLEQIVACLTISILIETVGRKRVTLGVYIMLSIFLLIFAIGIIVASSFNRYIKFTIYGSMYPVSLNIITMFVWSGELFGTPVRNAVIGLGVAYSKLGYILASFLGYLNKFHNNWIPAVIFVVAPILGFFACLLLPETKNKLMPDSTTEAGAIGVE